MSKRSLSIIRAARTFFVMVFAGLLPLLDGAAKGASGPGDVVGQCVAAYQGYFACGDTGQGWQKWSSDGNIPTLTNYQNGVWPDMRAYTTGTYLTNCPNFGSGQAASLYSSYDPGVTKIHLQWMKNNGMNTVAIGRFDPVGNYPVANEVATNIKGVAPGTGMKYYISYDLTGWTNASTECPQDWTNEVVGLMNLPSQTNYARQNGKPVVELWGPGILGNEPLTAAQDLSLIQWFQSQGCYVIVGTSWSWRTASAEAPFLPCFQAANMIQPWAIGTFGDIPGADSFQSQRQGDLTWCNSNGVDYQECVLPGDSRTTQRAHGNLMWEQFANLTSLGVKSAFISMFDEFGEGNQVIETAEDSSMVPTNASGVTLQGTNTTSFGTLDNDGTHCSSDYYMREVLDGYKMMNGQIPLTYTRPTSPVRKLIPGSNVSLLASANNEYVSADLNLASPPSLIADRTSHGQWETFTVVDMGNNNIALRSLANGAYVCADLNIANPPVLYADRTSPGAWETFSECDAGNGNFALRAMANNEFVCADNAGANPLIANRSTYAQWETYTAVSPAPYAPYLQIACGGEGAVGTYIADSFFSGFTVNGGVTNTYSSSASINTGASGAAPAAVYQNERNGQMTYTINVPQAIHAYTVKLHFAELYFTAGGQRQFNVAINGTRVLTNFDIFAAAGAMNKAVVQSFNVTSDSVGRLTIVFSNGAANTPKIDGIEIY